MRMVIFAVVALLFIGCSDDKKSSTTVVESVEVKPVEVVVEQDETPVEVAQAVEVILRTGEMIFVTCSGCHGIDASKKALGKSQVIKGWSSEKIMDALNGYKAGTYGGDAKAVMQGQASALKDEEIKTIAEYISNL